MKEDRRAKRPAERPPRRHPSERPTPPKRTIPEESPPDQERGERIETGKAIHRGGKSKGFVPGATEQTAES